MEEVPTSVSTHRLSVSEVSSIQVTTHKILDGENSATQVSAEILTHQGAFVQRCLWKQGKKGNIYKQQQMAGRCIEFSKQK